MLGIHIRKKHLNINMYKPRFPVYIISKGRWDRRPTVKTFELMGIDYFIVVEKQEYDNYAMNINKDKIKIIKNKEKQRIMKSCVSELLV